MGARVRIAHESWACEIAPLLGGAIASLTRAGEPVMRRPLAAFEREGARCGAAFPMIPYANRIANGRFQFGGNSYELARDGSGPHTLHGVGWRRAWRTVRAEASICEIAFEHTPDADWPFAFVALQHFALTADGLAITQSITSTEARPAPAGLGFHAYFPRRRDERLAFCADGAWSNGADLLPLALVSGEAWNFANGRAPGARVYDNDFVGWRGAARLSAPGRLTTWLRSTLNQLRVFTPAGRDDYAVEPVSHGADAIHHRERQGTMAVLRPGQTFTAVTQLGQGEAP